MLPISSGTIRENTNRWYLLKYTIFHVEILCEYTLRNTKSCVWISVNWTCTFDVISKTPYSVSNFPARPGPANDLIPILPTLTCTFPLGLKKRIRVNFHLKYYHTLNPVCTFNQYHKKIFNLHRTTHYKRIYLISHL